MKFSLKAQLLINAMSVCLIGLLVLELQDTEYKPSLQIQYVTEAFKPDSAAHLSEAERVDGKELVRRLEGLRLKAYKCKGNVWTIGYGHTKGVKEGMIISKAEAEELLDQDYAIAQAIVRKHVKIDLLHNQEVALTSFAFNVGEKQFARSTLVKYVNLHMFENARLEFAVWVYAANVWVEGLENRRYVEARVFSKV